MKLKELIDLLLNVKKLPAISNVVVLLEQHLGQEEPDIRKVGKIISDDPAITGMLLKVANSAAYGARREIGTVSEAVMRLGLKEVSCMVQALAMIRFLSDRPSGLLAPLPYWHHSIGVATCMDLIHSKTGIAGDCCSLINVVGLLHDVGRWVIANYLPELYHQVTPEMIIKHGSIDICKLERQEIGLDHTQIGAAILERWGLPLPIVQGVRYHHEPECSPKQQRDLARLIHLADNLCVINRIGDVGEGLGLEITTKHWKQVGLASDSGEQLVEEINANMKQSDVLLSIGGFEEKEEENGQ